MHSRCPITLLVLAMAATVAANKVPEIRVADTAGNPVRAEVRIDGAHVEVTAPGFLAWSGPLKAERDGTMRVVLVRPAVLRGRAMSPETGITGARVTMTAKKDEKETRRAVTDKGGLFELRGLPPGLHSVAAVAEGFVPFERTLSLREGEARWLDLPLHPSSILEARVVDAEEKPLRGVEARVRTENPDGRFLPEEDRARLEKLQAETDAQGRLVLGPLDRGMRQRIVFRRDRFARTSLTLVPSAPTVRKDVHLRRGGAIRLVLRDQRKSPIAGAVADLTSDDAPDVDLLPDPAPSGPDGVSSLAALPAGTYAIRIHVKGFRPRTLRGVEVRMGKVADLGDVTLEPGLDLAGVVRDDRGTPVEDAAVEARFYEQGRRLATRGRTDREGRFRISGLSEGDLEVRVEAKGCSPETRSPVSAGSEDLEIILSRSASIQGRVVDATTDLPVPAFTLELRSEHRKGAKRQPEREDRRADVQAPDGRFEVEDLRPTTYTLEVTARGFAPSVLEGIVARPDGSDPISVRMEGGQSLEGVVIDDQDGAPIAGANVSSQGPPAVVTDIEGRFRIDGLKGKARLWVDHPRYVQEVVADADPESTEPLTIRLRRGGSVEGMVYGNDAAPIPGAEVGEDLGSRSTLADGSGHYRLDGLRAGQRVIRKTDVPGTSLGYEMGIIEIQEGQVATYDFGRGVRLYGFVTHAGAPASGATLTLTRTAMPSGPPSPASSIRVREDGSYEARGLRPATYGLLVLFESRKLGRRITIEEGTPEQRLDIDLPDLWLSGEVVDRETRSPLRGRVIATRKAGADGGYSGSIGMGDEVLEYSSNPSSSIETDAQGRFHLSLLEPDTYSVDARVEGYRLEEPVQVEVNTVRNDVVLGMSPAIRLSAAAVDASTGRTIALRCLAVRAGDDNSTSCGFDVNTIGPLRPGRAIVAVSASGYAIAYRSVDLDDLQQEVSFRLTPGGTLHLLLPPDDRGEAAELVNTRLSVEDANGMNLSSLIAGREVLVPHPTTGGGTEIDNVPAGRLKISLGGGDEGQPSKTVEVTVPEGGEAVADLR